ncbi:MAG: hypothetical protein JKY96_03135, partial [Phycisphaerales bacterium]|nr:hypothetical protein [Phycisphaerales bacterium]
MSSERGEISSAAVRAIEASSVVSARVWRAALESMAGVRAALMVVMAATALRYFSEAMMAARAERVRAWILQ